MSLAVFITLFFLFAVPAKAIVILPALILIPIAKVIAVVIMALSVPSVTVGTIYSKLFGKSVRKTLLIIVIGLVLIGIFGAVGMKLVHPDRPWFSL